ncbi:MAG: glutamyl-tRNA reductase [Candidatus Omnitrophota bacterium]|nr:glutamyl-tRNA reductase [Candidatus Omnitrophota bacterium]
MNLALIGISHKTAPVRVRERFSFTTEELKEGLQKLKKIGSVRSVVVLSTCNRMEIYAQFDDVDLGMREITQFLVDTFSSGEDEIRRYFYTLNGANVVRHIFRVACGLDSQILGETQILGQVKSSREIASQAESICGLLDYLFIEAVRVGIRIRSLTKISQGNVSVGSAAIKMLEERSDSIQGKSVLVIGTGKIGGIVCNYLKDKNVKGIFVSNRTYTKACELASRCGGKAVNFNRLKSELRVSDIVISVTSSPHIILPYKTLSETMRLRNRPLLIMDLALPRDVDPMAKNIPGISLFTLDDLASVVEENCANRQEEAKSAEKMIQKMSDNFLRDKDKRKTEDLCLLGR